MSIVSKSASGKSLRRGVFYASFRVERPAGAKLCVAQLQVPMVWRIANGGSYVPSLVFYEGLLYMANELGVVTAVDAKSGESV